MDAETMSFTRIRMAAFYWVSRLARVHPRLENMVISLHRHFENLRLTKEFNDRISKVDPSQYLDMARKPTQNVIILAIDSLRRSHMSCEGYPRKTTPFLDSLPTRLAAISASSWTYPAVASILTGMYPHNHNAIVAGRLKDSAVPGSLRRLREDIVTLPEMMHFLGYNVYFSTAVCVAYYPLRGRVMPQVYNPTLRADELLIARAGCLLDDAADWICEAKDSSFFAYIHLGDLHVPINPPEGFVDFFGTVDNPPEYGNYAYTTPRMQNSDPEGLARFRETRRLLYDNALRYVDSAIEDFWSRLRSMGLADSTILIVTADHGDEFWEHAELAAASFYDKRGRHGTCHGHSVFNEVIEVPILVSTPLPHSESFRYVSTVDIAPTVLDLIGADHFIRFDGRSLLASAGDRPVLSEAPAFGYEKKALIVGRYKLIYSKDDGVEWVFDLETDPHEQNPITDRSVTTVFVDKLNAMLTQDELERVRQAAAQRRFRDRAPRSNRP